jgi:exodeoxyribonuclease-3
MKLATWNVNSVRAREGRLLRWLSAARPDVVCLQELKVPDEAFPVEALRQAGFRAAVHGQKTYNGVAVLARSEPTAAERGFGDGGDDAAARLLVVRLGELHVASAYVPNGGLVGSDKWAYKLDWLARLRRWLDRRFVKSDLVALCGDFNVAPEPRDVCDPEAWAASVLFHPEARAALEHVMAWGLVDALRLHRQEAGLYTWWDYRMLAFPKNRGLRIDHVLLSEPLARRCRSATIARDERKGQDPSDHVPVVVELELPAGSATSSAA